MPKKLLLCIIPVLVGLAIWLCPAPQAMVDAGHEQGWHLFALVAAIILAFIISPMPIGATAFIGITITALTKTLTVNEILAGFSSPSIWLIVSAFIFARSFIKTGLGNRIAYNIMAAIGDSSLKLGYAFSITQALIAPATPSSAARAGGILFPIVRGVCSAYNSEPGTTSRKIGGYLIQNLYQTESIVCAMFMTAMAGNPMMVEMANSTLGINMSWGGWLLASCVPGIISLVVMPYFLYKVYPPEIKKTPEAKTLAKAELQKLGPMSRHEKILTTVFIGAVFFWATGSFWGSIPSLAFLKINTTLVAMIAVSVMFLTGIISWSDFIKESGAWDTLIWMGALMLLAGQLSAKGFIPWFSTEVSSMMGGTSWIIALGILILVYIYSHYMFASLTAHISAMYPAFIAVAAAAGGPPMLVVLSMAFAANICLALTHYSGAPGPILFGAGYVDQRTWWKLGFAGSVVLIVIWIGIGSIWWKALGLW